MPESSETWVWLARIRRPQGRKGEVFAEILTDFPGKFAERRRLWLLSPQAVSPKSQLSANAGAPGPSHLGAGETMSVSRQARPVELANHWLHKGSIVLHFAGVDSISAAETLTGLIVAVPHSERVALAEDEVYIADLIGCALLDVSKVAAAGGDPVRVGEIEDVSRNSGPTPLLVVRGEAGEILVPFAKNFLRRIDLEARRVEMALPEGLLDLNA